jgi:nanoRNase/pAp phosphatase (c-di-AMP/oligoRNAs hydrolase)
MKTLILHHGSDFDGIFSGLFAKQHFEKSGPVTLIPVEYGDEFNHEWLSDYDKIVIADFSYPSEDMKLISKSSHCEWYDHHDYAIKLSTSNGYDKIPGVRINGVSAAQLVYGSLLQGNHFITPLFVRLLNAYDIHDTRDQDFYDRAKALNYYLSSCCQNEIEHLASVIKDLSGYSISEMVKVGFSIRRYEINRAKKFKKSTVVLDGESMTAYNGYSSELLELSELERIAMFEVGPEHTKFSLRSKESDVSEIARAYGGGGHRNACGFIIPTNELHNFLHLF